MSTTQTGTENPEQTPKESLVDHRIAKFEELGFTHTEATKLHGSYVTVKVGDREYQNRLSHHDVSKHMSQGATARQIVKIFT